MPSTFRYFEKISATWTWRTAITEPGRHKVRKCTDLKQITELGRRNERIRHPGSVILKNKMLCLTYLFPPLKLNESKSLFFWLIDPCLLSRVVAQATHDLS